MAIKKVYIQTRKQKKLHFVVGGYAYLLPKTSVNLRCPTRRFRKSMITWEKDDKRLISSAHITITPYGLIKINRLKPSDTGTYTCTAGSVQEHFVIKLIGSSKIIAREPASIREEETMRKPSLNEALRAEEKHVNRILFNGSKAEKRGHLVDPSGWYDYIVSRLMQYRGWPGENLESWEAQESTERNASSEEDQSREYSLPFTMITEQKRLDDIISNLSQQPEELKDVYTEQLVVQLAHEVFKSHLEHQESVIRASRKGLDSTSVEHPVHRHVSGFTSSLRTSSAEAFLPTSVDPQVSFMSLFLGCAVDGHPTPNITWLYSGKPLSLRHRLLAAGRILQILNVSDAPDGEFSCLAQNEAGLLTQKTSLAIQGNLTVSVKLCEALAMDFPALMPLSVFSKGLLMAVFECNMPSPHFLAEYQWSGDKLMACSASCGPKGVQLPQLRCLLDGVEVNISYCKEKPKPALQPIACNRRDCPSRWMVTSWSPCTRSCGGGIQIRRVTCQRLTVKGNSVPMSNEACAQVSKRPVDTQNCNRQPCVEWVASSWGQVRNNGVNLLPEQHGDSPPLSPPAHRPLSTQNCWTDLCGVHWRVSLWTVCTATCGNYGFQSRRVDCVHIRTNKPVMEHHCSWRPRPANWQRCNIMPCENGTLLRGGEPLRQGEEERRQTKHDHEGRPQRVSKSHATSNGPERSEATHNPGTCLEIH
uniref:Ig-like domain-containing protein n=1 Tax=Amazona collaria TaxID=241587 RepID=A0A8B9GJ67_9PSIT